MKKTIYIIRHGETDFNLRHIVQGSGVDTDLNATGRAQGQAFFEAYKELPFEVVLTSRLKRTHQTIQPFIEAGLPWEQFEDINELSWGVHEGKESTPGMRAEYRQIITEWKQGNYHASLVNGESAYEMGLRVTRFIEHLKERPESCLLVCAHGRLMRCLACLLDGQPMTQMNDYLHANTGLYEVNYDGTKFELLRQNDVQHLNVLEV